MEKQCKTTMKHKRINILLFIAFISIIMFSSCDDSLSSWKSNNLNGLNYKANGVLVGTKITDYSFIKKSDINEYKTYDDYGDLKSIRKSVSLYNEKVNMTAIDSILELEFDLLKIQTLDNSDVIKKVEVFESQIRTKTRTDIVHFAKEILGFATIDNITTRGSTRWPDSYWIYYKTTTPDGNNFTINYYESSDCHLGIGYDYPSLRIIYELKE